MNNTLLNKTQSAHTRAGSVATILFAALALSACGADSQLKNPSLNGPDANTSATPAYANDEPKTSNTNGFNPYTNTPETSTSRLVVIANPTRAQIYEKSPLPEMSIGRADAPVTIIKYASLTCPYCRKFHQTVFPKLKRNYIDTGKVRFIIREFPIGRSSGNASIALRCAPPAKYFELYGRFLVRQPKWVGQNVNLDAIHKVAAGVGLSRAQFDACLKNQDMIDGLKWVKNHGRTLGVIGTPNFFVQDQLVKNVLTYDDLSEKIDTLLRAPVASSNATPL